MVATICTKYTSQTNRNLIPKRDAITSIRLTTWQSLVNGPLFISTILKTILCKLPRTSSTTNFWVRIFTKAASSGSISQIKTEISSLFKTEDRVPFILCKREKTKVVSSFLQKSTLLESLRSTVTWKQQNPTPALRPSSECFIRPMTSLRPSFGGRKWKMLYMSETKWKWASQMSMRMWPMPTKMQSEGA